MKKIQLSVIAAVAALLAVTAVSCKKTPAPSAASLQIEVDGITATTATVHVTATGDAPTLVRFFSPVELSSLGINIQDKDAVAKYATDNGSAISLPYTTTVSSLEPFAEYAVGAVAFNADMKVTSATAVRFQTAAPDNAICEDGDGAGSVTERIL